MYYHDSETDKSATSPMKGKAIRNFHCLANKLYHTTSTTEMCLCYICFLSDWSNLFIFFLFDSNILDKNTQEVYRCNVYFSKFFI
jgi:hypothetical protein